MTDDNGDLMARLAELEATQAALVEENRRLRGALKAAGGPKYRKRRRQEAKEDSGRILAYARASSAKQEDSVAMQIDQIRKRVAELPGELFEPIFIDDGVSATRTRWCERKGYLALMDALKPGDRLVMTRMDRIEGSPFAMLDGLRWLAEAGVRVHFLEHGGFEMDLDSALGKAVVIAMAGWAGMFVDQLQEVCRYAYNFRVEQGLATGQLRYGIRRVHRLVDNPKKPGEKKLQGYDSWDPHDCQIIREIWRRHALQGESFYAIARDLHQRHEKRSDGRPWARQRLRRYRKGSAAQHSDYTDNAIGQAFWRYATILAAGKDLEDQQPDPEQVAAARAWLAEQEAAARAARVARGKAIDVLEILKTPLPISGASSTKGGSDARAQS